MPSPIEKLIVQLLEDALTNHDNNPKLDLILRGLASIDTSVKTIEDGVAAIKTSVQSIQAFLGAPDGTISAEDQATLDAKLAADAATAKQITDLATEVGQINTQPPV